jgi:hypothetical protein
VIDDESEVLARLKNGELTRRTNEQPSNLSAWLDLIDHQSTLLGGDRSSSRVISRNLADIRLSIYEKALQKVGNDPEARSTLWLGVLREGAVIWEAKKLANKWQEVLQAHLESLRIWTQYLNFIQTHFLEFRYERCKSEYAKCLQLLADAINRAPTGSSDHDKISKIFAYVYLRLTLFMQEAGFQEHAEALWQAILEVYFFHPKQLQSDSSNTDLLASFEEFWESEVPRIGELNAQGWSNFTPENEELVDSVTTELESVEDFDQPFREFATTERNMARKLNHPGRSADESGEDDPYHIIFFNDLGPFISPKAINSLPRKHVLTAFLYYLGLPPLKTPDRSHDDWGLDAFLRRNTINIASGNPILRHRQIDSEILFSDAFEGIELSDPIWVRRSLKRLVEVISDDEAFAEYAIAFDLRFFPEM